MPLFALNQDNIAFPDPSFSEPDGLLAIGGDLSTARLLEAYRLGIFPWYNPGEEILWWSLNPRFVLFPDELKVAKSMRPYFNQKKFTVSFDTCFETVMRASQRQIRNGQNGSWISEDLIASYTQLHEMGYGHSVEVWKGDELVGGLYGLSLGKMFFGESMFSKVPNASKFGFITLVQNLKALNFTLIDCQQETRHLASLGAKTIPRKDFLQKLRANESEENFVGNWGELF